MKYLMGIDEGTTGCKAILFSEYGDLIASSGKEYPSYYPFPGWVEQDINEIKEAIFTCSRETVSKAIDKGIDPKDIIGIGHSNQGITMVLLDEQEQPVFEHVIGWQDLRHVEITENIKNEIDLNEYRQLSGMNFGTYNISVLRWLENYETDKWSKVKRICSHQDYFLRQYGADGYYIDEGSANFLSMARMKDSEWDKTLMDVYHINQNMLPKVIHSPGTILGHIHKKIAKQMSLPEGCNICLAGLDTNCCALGAGVYEQGTQVLVVGTAGVSIVITDRDRLDPNQRIAVRSNPGFSNWQNYIMTNTGASTFRWFRDALCMMEVSTSKLVDMDPYDLIISMAAQSKPGANGVIALTCIQGSHTRIKNENARGSFLGISLGTTKADIAEAILEGICFEMRDILDMNEELSGTVNHVRLCGGVSKSPKWCQMFADILNKPIELTEISELGSFGAALCAGIGSGIFDNCEDAIKKCVKIKSVYKPNKEKGEIYNKIYDKWKKFYKVSNEQIYIL